MENTVVIISPDAVKRQLAGLIISRLLVRCKLEILGAQLVNLTAQDAGKIAEAMPEVANFDQLDSAPAMFCLFSGKNAIASVDRAVNDTALLPAANLAAVGSSKEAMQAVAAVTRRNNLLKAVPVADKERTLLIIKPENFRAPSCRPGMIIDMLMSLNLEWVGCKVHSMTVNDALEFYGPVRHVLRSKLMQKIGSKALAMVENEFDFKLSANDADTLIATVGNGFADSQFEDIVEFMSGKRPSDVPESDRNNPGDAKCMVLIFDGKNAVSKIRTILGPTNPAQATGGTVRYDFGTNIMVNAAHASDSIESYERESKIVRVEENTFSDIAANLA